MDVTTYLQDPCGTLSIPYWKAKALTVPDAIRIIHSRDWHGQYSDFQRYFRVKHSLRQFDSAARDCDTISIDVQAAQLCEMINASYRHEDITVSEEDLLRWKKHETFQEELWVCIHTEDGTMAASGIAAYDAECGEGTLEWVQTLPAYRGRGLGKTIVACLLSRLKDIGAEFATVSGRLDSPVQPLELYKKCGFEGGDVWYICRG